MALSWQFNSCNSLPINNMNLCTKMTGKLYWFTVLHKMRAAAMAGNIISENKRLSCKFMKGENSFCWRRHFRSRLEMLKVRYLDLNSLVQHSRCELDLKSLYRTSKSQNRWGLHTMRFSLQEMMRIRSCFRLLLIVIMLHLCVTWHKRDMNFAVELYI